VGVGLEEVGDAVGEAVTETVTEAVAGAGRVPGSVLVAGGAAVLPVPVVVVLVPVLVLVAVPVVPGAHMGPLSGSSSGFRCARWTR
jgi:hypothetical protein